MTLTAGSLTELPPDNPTRADGLRCGLREKGI